MLPIGTDERRRRRRDEAAGGACSGPRSLGMGKCGREEELAPKGASSLLPERISGNHLVQPSTTTFDRSQPRSNSALAEARSPSRRRRTTGSSTLTITESKK